MSSNYDNTFGLCWIWKTMYVIKMNVMMLRFMLLVIDVIGNRCLGLRMFAMIDGLI